MKRLKQILLILTTILLAGCFQDVSNKTIKANKTKGELENRLFEAVRDNHLEIVKSLLDRGVTVKVADDGDLTLLHYACQNNNIEIVRLLLEHGAAVDVGDIEQQTPLYCACSEGYTEIAQLLIEKGASVNIPDKDRRFMLHIACREGHLEMVRLLLNNLAYINARDKDALLPLHYACYNGHSEIVKLLLDYGSDVDINATDRLGITPLHEACQKGYAEIIKLLLSCDANLNIADSEGITAIGLLFKSATEDKTLKPLFISLINYELRIFRLLLESRIDEVRKSTFEQLKAFKNLDGLKLEEKNALTALKIMQDVGLHLPIVNKIFTDSVEFIALDNICKFIIKNPEFKFDETIFVKIEAEKIKKANSFTIINLLIENMYETK